MSKFSNYATTVLVLYAAGIEQLRFGYVNRTANSVLTYEGNETYATVFPGEKDCSYMKLQCPTSQKPFPLSTHDVYKCRQCIVATLLCIRVALWNVTLLWNEPGSMKLYLHNSKIICNTSDGVPPDGTPQEVIHTFQLGLVVVFYFLAAVGFIFSVACLLFNFLFTKRR